MRITIDIADDVLQVARDRARRDRKSVGSIISELARSTLKAVPEATEPARIHGMGPFAARGGVVTNDLIDKLREDCS
ncbi:MAG: antitoxin [Casimicrobiaceae bacterium]